MWRKQLSNVGGNSALWDRLICGVKWNVLETAIVALGNFAAAIVAARLLGLDDFGGFSIIRSTVYMMASVAGMGLGVTATKYIAELRNSNVSRLTSVLGLCSAIAVGTSLCFAGALLLFAPEIAIYNLKAPQITEQLRLAAFYILFVAINGYQIGVLVGFEAFASLARINLIQVVSLLTISFLFTWFWGLTGASIALGITALINCFLHHLAMKKELRRYRITIRYTELWREKGVLTDFAFPAALSGVIGAVSVWSCNAIIVRQADGLAQMALFAAAYNVRSLILFAPGLVTRVAAPILCNLVGDNDSSNYSRLFWFNVAVSAAAAVVVAGVLAAAAPYLLVLFGKEFIDGGVVIPVVAAMSVVEVIANVFYQPLYAHGKLWWQLWIIICWSVVLIGISFTAAENYGALGLAYAYLAAHIVSATLYIFAGFQIKSQQEPQKV